MMTAIFVSLGTIYLASAAVLLHGVRKAPLVDDAQEEETVSEQG